MFSPTQPDFGYNELAKETLHTLLYSTSLPPAVLKVLI